MPFRKEELLPKLENVIPNGAGKYKADCPGHISKSKQSLSITEIDEHYVITHCFGGCSFEDVLSAIGLSINGADSPKVFKTDDLPKDEYFGFESLNGDILYMQRHKGAYYRPVGDDLWVANLIGVSPVLYNLPGLVETLQAGGLLIH